MKGRVFLLLQNRHDAGRLSRDLDAKGWSCVVKLEGRPVRTANADLRGHRPVASKVRRARRGPSVRLLQRSVRQTVPG